MKPYPHFTLNHLTVPVTFSAVENQKERLKYHFLNHADFFTENTFHYLVIYSKVLVTGIQTYM